MRPFPCWSTCFFKSAFTTVNSFLHSSSRLSYNAKGGGGLGLLAGSTGVVVVVVVELLASSLLLLIVVVVCKKYSSFLKIKKINFVQLLGFFFIGSAKYSWAYSAVPRHKWRLVAVQPFWLAPRKMRVIWICKKCTKTKYNWSQVLLKCSLRSCKFWNFCGWTWPCWDAICAKISSILATIC